MKTTSLKLPHKLEVRLRELAVRQRRSKSDIVRVALDLYLEAEGRGAGSFADLACDLVGCVSGRADLSCNPEYMDGYGG